jgi:hypothetical protein
MLVEFLGQEPGDYIEIFVVMSGEPTRVFLCGVDRAAGRWDVMSGELEFVGTKHSKIFSKIQD